MSLKRHSAADWSYWLVIGALASFALIIMIGPVVVVLATSLTENRSLKFPPTGMSFQWYRQLFDESVSRQIHRAAGNSLTVAAWATSAAVLFGTLAAMGISRSRARLARVLDAVFMSPMILPGLSFGLAALMYFTLLGFRPSLNLIIIGHALLIVPFVQPVGWILAGVFRQSWCQLVLYLSPGHATHHRAGYCRGRLPRVHGLDRQCAHFALSVRTAH
ncbi:MAG: hypothetical protein RLZZ153_960 [Pseudomonadota bacterium]|jgi:putative spermidine/putrescine transport system permease protein